MYKYTEKEKIPSFFLQQASKYMLKCSKITEMDRDIYHALHDVHLAARMSRAFLNKIKQYGLLLEMGERWNYDNCYYDVQIIVCNVDWFLPV